MPTICKISLDASEYRAELARVVAESKAAAAEMSRAVSPASGNPSDRFDGSDRSDVAISVTADTAKAEAALSVFAETAGQTEATVSVDADITEAKAAVDGLAETVVHVPVTVDPDSSVKPIQKIRDELKAIPAEDFGNRAKRAAEDFKNSLLSGKKPLEQLREGLQSLLNPWSLLIAAAGALMTVGVKVWNHLIGSAETYAAHAARAPEESRRELDSVREMDRVTAGYMSRLRELSAADGMVNAGKLETARLLEILTARYGDLGGKIDSATGKILNFDAVESRLREKRAQILSEKEDAAAKSDLESAAGSYAAVKGGEWLTSEGGAAIDFRRNTLFADKKQLQEKLAEMEMLSRLGNSAGEISGYSAVAEKLRSAIAHMNVSENLRKTGFSNDEEAALSGLTQKREQDRIAAAAAAKEAARDEQARVDRLAANDRLIQRRQQLVSRTAQDAYGNLRSPEDKVVYANREIEILRAQISRAREQGETAQTESALGKNKKDRDEAQSRYLTAQERIQTATESLYDWERQIAELQKQTAESKKKLADDADFERKSAELAAAGEMKKVEALKLEKELRDQNLKLTQKEKDAILEARAAVREQNYRSGIENQAAALYGQAMQNAGRGREWSEQSALRDARKQKGGELSGTDVEMVKKLAAISYRLEDKSGGRPGNFDIKTNELTARGGFATGVRVPEADKINREIANYNKSQVELLRQISDICKNLGVFK